MVIVVVDDDGSRSGTSGSGYGYGWVEEKGYRVKELDIDGCFRFGECIGC